MDGWAEVLRQRFGSALSELLGLHNVETAQDFEQHLGDLTRWLELVALNERFSWMTSGTDDGRDIQVTHYEAALRSAAERGERFQRTLDETLAELFGPGSFAASDVLGRAYNILLSAVGSDGRRPDEIVCATTNYDRSLELALASIYQQVRTGFRHDGIMRSTLEADGLGTFKRQPSLLYLHGAVGWYRSEDGGVVAYPAADPYRPDLGRPGVLYPSKNKVVEDSVVRDIWVELDAALANATHVLVLGHGLGDDHLVQRLRETDATLAVTCFSDEDGVRIESALPNAYPIHVDFGPKPNWDRKRLAIWKSMTTT